jgi:hypothetical protein
LVTDIEVGDDGVPTRNDAVADFAPSPTVFVALTEHEYVTPFTMPETLIAVNGATASELDFDVRPCAEHIAVYLLIGDAP